VNRSSSCRPFVFGDCPSPTVHVLEISFGFPQAPANMQFTNRACFDAIFEIPTKPPWPLINCFLVPSFPVLLSDPLRLGIRPPCADRCLRLPSSSLQKTYSFFRSTQDVLTPTSSMGCCSSTYSIVSCKFSLRLLLVYTSSHSSFTETFYVDRPPNGTFCVTKGSQHSVPSQCRASASFLVVVDSSPPLGFILIFSP